MKLFFSFFFLASCSHWQKIPEVPLAPQEVLEEHEAFGLNFLIASQGQHATDAGTEILRAGGNAVDAALAVSFTISVERPQSTGLGGGGFMLLTLPGWSMPISIDFREEAPLRASSTMFLDEKGEEVPELSSVGVLSGAVPGLVAGLIEIHKNFGKLPLKTIMAPAIRLAREGFAVYPYLAQALEDSAEVLAKFESSKKIFFSKEGRVLQEGDILVQKDLARTLELIAEKGRDGFYKGSVAKAILAMTKKNKGLITQKDLDNYRPRTRKPLHGTFLGHDIYSMGPPSSGGAHVLQILNMVEHDELKAWGPGHAKSVQLMAEAMKLAFVDRAAYLGDSDFVDVPIKGLINKNYAAHLRQGIDLEKAQKADTLTPGNPVPYESPETTHFTLMDKAGAVVSSTQTINGYFGSGMVIEGTGVLLNNEMDDFATKVGAQNIYGAVGGNKNLIAPKKRPLSSMSPTIVFKDGKPLLALGSPSGTRILTCVAQSLVNYLQHDMPLYESLSAVRFHHQWRPDELWVESPGLAPETEVALREKGQELKRKNLGCRVQAVAWEENQLHGVSDPRGEGKVGGE